MAGSVTDVIRLVVCHEFHGQDKRYMGVNIVILDLSQLSRLIEVAWRIV